MSAARSILDAAFADIAEQADKLGSQYAAQLDSFRVNALAVLDDVAAGKVTPEQAVTAAEQSKNALLSTLISAGFAARAEAQDAALKVVLAVLRAGLVAVV